MKIAYIPAQMSKQVKELPTGLPTDGSVVGSSSPILPFSPAVCEVVEALDLNHVWLRSLMEFL
jgi:hypothetical protein